MRDYILEHGTGAYDIIGDIIGNNEAEACRSYAERMEGRDGDHEIFQKSLGTTWLEIFERHLPRFLTGVCAERWRTSENIATKKADITRFIKWTQKQIGEHDDERDGELKDYVDEEEEVI